MTQKRGFSADFKRLTPELQTSLLKLQESGENSFVFLKKVKLLRLLPAAALIAWIVFVAIETQQLLWDSWMYWLIGSISLLLFPIGVVSVLQFIASKTARLKSGYMFTPNEYFVVRDRVVICHPLRDIDALRTKEDQQQIELWIDDKETLISVDDFAAARDLENHFDQWKATLTDDLATKLQDPAFAYQKSGRMATLGGAVAVAIILAIGFTYGVSAANRSYDDELTWNNAKNLDSIEEYEAYKNRHPSGSHASAADDAISGQVGKLKEGYLARVRKTAAPDAVTALAAIYDAVSKRPARTIYIKTSETREIDSESVSVLHAKFGVEIQPYDYTVPPSGEPFRREKLVSDLKILLSQSMPRGAIKYQVVDELPPDEPSVNVRLAIKSDEKFYRILSLEDGRYNARYYPVASFTFNFTLRSSAADAGYSSEYFEEPMGVSSGVYDRRDKENYTFDKILFSAVMEGFDSTFSKIFGFAEDKVQ